MATVANSPWAMEPPIIGSDASKPLVNLVTKLWHRLNENSAIGVLFSFFVHVCGFFTHAFCSFSFSLSRNLVSLIGIEELDMWAQFLLPIPAVTKYSSCQLWHFVLLSTANFSTFALDLSSPIQLWITLQFQIVLLCGSCTMCFVPLVCCSLLGHSKG